MNGVSINLLKILFPFIFLIRAFSGSAQQPDFEFGTFNALSDITSSKTTVIVEDSIGYLWIGTEEGLFRFDGQTIYPYFFDINNPKSLPSNGINNLVLDHENNLWIGSKAGICKFNREFNDFTIVPDKSEMKGFENCFIKVFTFDQTGQLFVAYNKVIYSYTKSEGQFSKVVKLDQGDISSMLFDDQNNLWIGTINKGGLFCYDGNKKQLVPYLNDPANSQSISINEINKLALSGNTLWIGTLGKGIDTYDLKNKTFKHYCFSRNLENYINSIYVSKDQKAWVCTLCNFKLFNPNTDNFYDYYHDLENPYSVGRSMQGIFEDRAGNLWNIHSFGGIRLVRKNLPFKHVVENSERFWSTSEKIITAMGHDANGQFWISNHSMGIDIYNLQKRTSIKLRHNEKNPRSIPDGIIFSIYRDLKNQMWIGSYMGGLQKYNTETNDFDSYLHNAGDSLSIASNDVRSISEDPSGDLWLATHREGVDRFDIRKKIFYHYNLKNNSLCDQYTNQVFVDSRGNLWVATAWGLGFLRQGEHLFKNYHYNKNDTSSIGNNEIQTIYEDKLKNIWIGTNGGLNKFNYKTQKFSRYSSGLKNKHIASILSDHKNNIWVSTSTSISMFNPVTLRFTNYNQSYGILSKEFYDRSCSTDSAGNLFFGGSDGYDFFNPDSIKAEARNPKVILSDFKLFNKSVSYLNDSQIIDRNISYAKKISLNYFQNSIILMYQAISLTEANNIEYAYKLDGFDKKWVQAGKERGASYTNLNPGNYTFRVKAKFENGDWNDNYTSIELEVIPPWWMTSWFRILSGLLFLTSIYAFFYFRFKMLRHQSKMLEKTVVERTTEILHKNDLLLAQALTLEQKNDQLKTLNSTKDKLFSIISHDLRSPFHTILGFQSLLLKFYDTYSDAERKKMMSQIHSASNKVYDLVENLLNWAIIQTGNIKSNPVEFNVNKVISRTYDLYQTIATSKGIVLNQQIPDQLVAFADVNLLKFTLRNLLNNAIKFTPGGGTIDVLADKNHRFIKISVTDSGIGLTQKEIDNLFTIDKVQTKYGTKGERGSGIGIVLCKEFIEKNKGTIAVKSQPGIGSTFSFTIPILPSE
ncbi:MAG: two-component regulator propeller domain-containing protein [Bacteroidia bacterium]